MVLGRAYCAPARIADRGAVINACNSGRKALFPQNQSQAYGSVCRWGEGPNYFSISPICLYWLTTQYCIIIASPSQKVWDKNKRSSTPCFHRPKCCAAVSDPGLSFDAWTIYILDTSIQSVNYVVGHEKQSASEIIDAAGFTTYNHGRVSTNKLPTRWWTRGVFLDRCESMAKPRSHSPLKEHHLIFFFLFACFFLSAF